MVVVCTTRTTKAFDNGVKGITSVGYYVTGGDHPPVWMCHVPSRSLVEFVLLLLLFCHFVLVISTILLWRDVCPCHRHSAFSVISSCNSYGKMKCYLARRVHVWSFVDAPYFPFLFCTCQDSSASVDCFFQIFSKFHHSLLIPIKSQYSISTELDDNNWLVEHDQLQTQPNSSLRAGYGKCVPGLLLLTENTKLNW